MRDYLKIKIGSLAAEARLIRNLERRKRQQVRWLRSKPLDTMHQPDLSTHELVRQGLHQHRTDVVRREARHSHLAYGFLRGVPYALMEQNAHSKPDLSLIEGIATRFYRGTTQDRRQKWAEWEDGFKAHYERPKAHKPTKARKPHKSYEEYLWHELGGNP